MRSLLFVLVVAFLASTWAQTCPRCTPLCQNGDGTTKTCGDDGCGGSCGTCAFGQECCRGACVCSPSCSGRQCGDDGCGGTSCGSCASTQTCSNGVCVGTAVAECSGRVCGSNRAGGSCGSCSTGQRCRAGQCECYYDCNERNCGNAVQADGTNFGLCPQRSCGTCPTGFTCGTNGRCSALTPCTISITVVDCSTRRALSTVSSVVISGTSYSTTISVSAGVAASWDVPALGTYSFTTSASGYLTSNVSQTITTSTTAIELCVNPGTVQIDVRNSVTNRTIEVGAGITYSGVISGSFRWSGVQTFQHGGFGSYSFVANPDSLYLQGSLNTQITSTTTLIIIYVNPATVQVDVRNQDTNQSINVGTGIVYTTTAASGSFSFRWTGLMTIQHNGYGTYSFTATPDSTYTVGTLTTSISASTTLIIIYVRVASFCGDGECSGTETATNCFLDCVSLFLEFENADGSGPVNGPTVNYFLQSPRDANENTGPNRNSVQATTSRTTGTGSNTVLEETYGYNQIVYIETKVGTNSFIDFYWRADTSVVDSSLGVWRLRVHLSAILGANNLNYRFVNTWRPIDAEPSPYAPTDLNLHSFHSAGALDINNARLLDASGNLIGQSVADSKQSGGPATMDISPGSGVLVALWNSKPPRNSAIAPSQNNRYLKNSGSYVVFYGKTSNAATGKQLGEITLDSILPALGGGSNSHDLWYVGTFTVSQPAQNQPDIVSKGTMKAASINSARDMIFDCEAYSYCATFRVPYSDTGRK